MKSTEEYDSKKEVSIYVQEVTPVNSTKIQLYSDEFKIGQEVTFEATSHGGKEVVMNFIL